MMRISSVAKFAVAGAIVLIAALAYVASADKPAPLAPDLPPQAAGVAKAHLPFGPVNPRKPAPAIALAMQDGGLGSLADPARGRWLLAQLIFTNCATTCPLQGAIFQRTQQLLKEQGLDADLMSISIDADRDDVAALRSWLAGFDAGENWRAGVAAKRDVGELLDFFNGRKSGLDIHDARVYFIDPQGRLAYTTEDLPDPTALVALLRQALASDQSLRNQK